MLAHSNQSCARCLVMAKQDQEIKQRRHLCLDSRLRLLRKLSHSENRDHLCRNSRSTTANSLHNFMVAFHHHIAYVLKGLVQLQKVIYQEHSLSWSLGASDQELYPAKKHVLDVMLLSALHLIKIVKTIDSVGKLQLEHGSDIIVTCLKFHINGTLPGFSCCFCNVEDDRLCEKPRVCT